MYDDVEDAMLLCVGAIARELGRELQRVIKERTRIRRRWWVKPWIGRRNESGAAATVLREWVEETPEDFRGHLRMSAAQFEDLLEKVSPVIQKADTSCRDAVPARIKLASTLRYLATGDQMSSVSSLYRIGKSTLSTFVPEVCGAICKSLASYIQVGTQKEKRVNKRSVRVVTSRPRHEKKASENFIVGNIQVTGNARVLKIGLLDKCSGRSGASEAINDALGKRG